MKKFLTFNYHEYQSGSKSTDVIDVKKIFLKDNLFAIDLF